MTSRDSSGGKNFRPSRTIAALVPAAIFAAAMFCCNQAHAAFNEIITGARPQGMGGAFVAVADDANAMYWNPAGLAGVRRDQGTFMHARKFSLNVGPSLEADYVGLASRPRSWGSVGFFYSGEGSEEILTERVIGVSYGKKVGEYFSLGMNLKAMKTDPRGKQTDANDPAMDEQTTAGVDLGLMYDASKELKLGVVGRNLGAKVGKVVERDIDPGLRFGLSYTPGSNWLLSADISSRKDIREKQGYTHLLSGGIEYILNDFLALRAGVNNSHVALGLGFMKRDWQLDYAFWNSNIGDTHRISATMKFGEDEMFEKMELPSKAPSIDIVKIENREDLERILDQAGEVKEPDALRNYRIKRAIEAETSGTPETIRRLEKALEGHNIENMNRLQKMAAMDMEPTDARKFILEDAAETIKAAFDRAADSREMAPAPGNQPTRKQPVENVSAEETFSQAEHTKSSKPDGTIKSGSEMKSGAEVKSDAAIKPDGAIKAAPGTAEPSRSELLDRARAILGRCRGEFRNSEEDSGAGGASNLETGVSTEATTMAAASPEQVPPSAPAEMDGSPNPVETIPAGPAEETAKPLQLPELSAASESSPAEELPALAEAGPLVAQAAPAVTGESIDEPESLVEASESKASDQAGGISPPSPVTQELSAATGATCEIDTVETAEPAPSEPEAASEPFDRKKVLESLRAKIRMQKASAGADPIEVASSETPAAPAETPILETASLPRQFAPMESFELTVPEIGVKAEGKLTSEVWVPSVHETVPEIRVVQAGIESMSIPPVTDSVESDLESAIDRELARNDREISESLVKINGLSTPPATPEPKAEESTSPVSGIGISAEISLGSPESEGVVMSLTKDMVAVGTPNLSVQAANGLFTADEKAEELMIRAGEKFAANDFDAALEIYKRVAEISPTCAIAHYKAGIICRMKGQMEKAREYITRGFELDPKSVYSKYRLILK